MTIKPFSPRLSAGIVALLALMLMVVPDTAVAQFGGHTLRGKIYLPGNQPPPGSVRVRLISRGTLAGESFTDAGGNFVFTRVLNGNYQIIVESDNLTFETTVVEVEVFFRSGNNLPQTVTRDINVTPLKKKDGLTNAESGREIDASVPKDAKKEFEKGTKSAKKGNSQEAIGHFEQAIKIHPAYYDAHVAIGEEYARLRNFAAARQSFNKAIESRPKSPQAHLSLGMVMVKAGEHSDAVPVLRQALELGEKNTPTYLFLGVALMETGVNDEAEKMLLKAHDIGGNTQPGIRLYLANFYNRVGERKKTLEQLEAYVREAPTASNVSEIEKLIKHIKEQK